MLVYKMMMFFKTVGSRISYTAKYLFSSKFYVSEEERKQEIVRRERNRERLARQLKNDEFRVYTNRERTDKNDTIVEFSSIDGGKRNVK